jgi:hypothetical protein
VSENALLRIIFGLNRDDETATGKITLSNEERLVLYFSVCIALHSPG